MAAAHFIAPMKATSGPLPMGDGWATELKWDGMRIQIRCREGRVTLTSGSGRDVTGSFPELAGLATELGTDTVLDAEAVVFDRGRPSFSRLQNRIHVTSPTPLLIAAHPIVAIVFDLLEVDDRSLLELPYRERRRLLVDLVEPGPSWNVPVHSEDDPTVLFTLAETRDLEGVVCKRLDSPYRAGVRSADWVKVKIRKRQEFVVGGWLPGSGGLTGTIGSLLVGVYDTAATELQLAGAVGSGLDDVERSHLTRLLVPGPCPFGAPIGPFDRDPQWVDPTIVVEVEYSIWAPGKSLWHPVYRGRRIDREPTEVIREESGQPER